MIRKGITFIQSIGGNLLGNALHNRLTHIVETSDWAIKNVGISLTHSLNNQHLVCSRISYTPIGLRNQVIHFDSVHTFFKKKSLARPHQSNKVILSWFHVEPGDPRLNMIQKAQESIERIHTSCEATKAVFMHAGIAEKKIAVIPLGVDLNLFTPASQKERIKIRKQLGIPENRFVIGSFQKDGVGWGEGLQPKLIKGPDLFVQVMDRLRNYRPFALLTGPARGYVKTELEKRQIDYCHVYPKNFHELPKMYHALDLYLIASRVEGGPLALLESWASGIPVVATRVGMVPDLARDEETALFADVEDVDMLTRHIERLMSDNTLSKQLASQALKRVENYSWDKIARRYFEELYLPLL